MSGELCLVIIPSRGRSGRLADMLDALLSRSGDGVHAAIGYDEDDPRSADYAALAGEVRAAWPGRTFWHRGRRKNLAGWTNHLAIAWPRAARYPYLASLGDDHLLRTDGGIETLCAAIVQGGGEGIAYGDDRHQHENLPTAPVISAGIVRVLGWMVLPGIASKFCDNAWRDIADLAGCRHYVPDVIIEHVHPDAQKSSWDLTYADGHRYWAADEAVYLTWCRDGQRDLDVIAVRNVLKLAAQNNATAPSRLGGLP